MGCSQRPDVIIITLDTLRVDHVGAFSDSSPALTPNIDALAKDGVVYSNCYSPISVTGPAFVTLHTGQDPETHEVLMNVFRGGRFLSKETQTLAEQFQDYGYNTGGFVSGFTLRRSLGLDQGFDVYDTPPVTQNRRWGNKTATKSIRWLKQQTGRIFMWYHSYDAHGPWNRWIPTPKLEEELTPEQQAEYDKIQKHTPKYQRIKDLTTIDGYKARYAKSVEFADKQVGRIIAELKERKRYENSIIVLTADHGESFDERELWFDHGTTPHEEQLHVPLVIKYPNNADAGNRDDRLVGLKDIAPTVTAAGKINRLPVLDGHSLLDLEWGGWDVLKGESSHCKGEKVLRCTPVGPRGKSFGVRSKTHSAFLFPTEEGDHLYGHELIDDQMELRPTSVPSELLPTLQDLTQHRRSAAAELVWPPPSKKSEDKKQDTEMEMLKSLGYIDADE